MAAAAKLPTSKKNSGAHSAHNSYYFKKKMVAIEVFIIKKELTEVKISALITDHNIQY